MANIQIRAFFIWLPLCSIVTVSLSQTLNTSTTSTVTSSETGAWKEIFTNNTKWTGSYKYDGVLYSSSLSISAISSTSNIMYASFMDKDTDIEFEGYSVDDRIIDLRKSITFRATSDRILPNENFGLRAILIPKDETRWILLGNVTIPPVNKFSDFELQSYPVEVSQPEESSNTKQIGLVVGIVIVCILIGAGVFVFTVVWGVRKGWIRHVPFTYKNFKNPDVGFNADEGHVHI